ncbi:PqqD family protein [uncultured Fusobacterium sp.]|uniref:PqqD family protein n=1 Tax=uncultured Fusobacterium sp. TaxID=159267 RepID=UPI00265F143D|nr:PqqD family protein [uncultured Fusobacterium sp.]
MRLKDDFILHNTGEEFIIIAIGEATKNFNGIIKLNNMGGEIVELLATDISEEDIIKAIVEKYEVEYETAKEDILNLLDSLRTAGVILD